MKKSIVTFCAIGILLLMVLPMVGDNTQYNILSVRGKPADKPGKPGGGGGDTPPPPAEGDGIANKYALCIGISNYASPENVLEYCDEDAQDWANFFDDNGYTVKLLIDATAQEIVDGLWWLHDVQDGDDYVALTYSGHGVYVSQWKSSCWISADEMYITQTDIKAVITDNFASQHVFMFLDCCNAGTFSKCVGYGWVAGIGSSTRSYTYDGDETMENGYYTFFAMYAIDPEGYTTAEDICEFAEVYFEYYTPGRASTLDQFDGYMTF